MAKSSSNRCVVPGCGIFYSKNDLERVQFHSIPIDPELHRKWLQAINHPDITEDTPVSRTRRFRVCGLHFDHITEDTDLKKKYLSGKSEAFKVLRDIVKDNSLLKDLKQLTEYHHTGKQKTIMQQ